MANTALSIQRERAGAGTSVVGTSNGPETPVTTNPTSSIINEVGIPIGKPTPGTGDPLLGTPRAVIETSKAQRPLGDIIQAAAEALRIP